MSCPSCGSRPPRIGLDALGFLSGPHALHHAAALLKFDPDRERTRNCDDGILHLRCCCCGGDVEVSIAEELEIEDEDGDRMSVDALLAELHERRRHTRHLDAIVKRLRFMLTSTFSGDVREYVAQIVNDYDNGALEGDD